MDSEFLNEEPPIPSLRKRRRQDEQDSKDTTETPQIQGDDDDYMSEQFLERISKNDTSKETTYLQLRKQARRESERKQERDRELNMKNTEEARREEGLRTAIPPENKGFKLLSKMGYIPGSSLGKPPPSTPNDTAISVDKDVDKKMDDSDEKVGERLVEPISVNMRKKRFGIGAESKVDESKRESEKSYFDNIKKREDEIRDKSIEFKLASSAVYSKRFTMVDIKNSLSAASTLDQAKGLSSMYTSLDLLSALTFPNGREDARGGGDRINGLVDGYDESLNVTSGKAGECSREDEMVNLLGEITLYLRQTHFYCQWCGIEYSDKQDMDENCPGDTRHLHSI